MKIKYLFLCCLPLFSCKTDIKEAKDNTVDVRLVAEPDQLNPIMTTQEIAKQIEWQLFMPLLQYDSKDLNLYPVLAKSRPEIEPIVSGPYDGGRKYTFELRPEARWDDGQAITGKDVVFTFKTILHPEISFPGLRAFLSFIKKIEIDSVNAKRFSVYTDQPINLAEEVIGTMAIYPEHIFDPNAWMAKHSIDVFTEAEQIKHRVTEDSTLSAFARFFKTIGLPGDQNHLAASGPYQVKSWEQGQKIILEKKENWWATTLEENHQSFQQFPDRIVYHFIEEDATLSTMLKSQQIDVAAAIDPSDFEDLKNSDLIQQHYNFFTPLSSSYSYIGFNTKNAKLTDRKTRQALSHLLNIDEVIQVVMNKYAVPLTGPILPNKAYYHHGLKPRRFNVEKARQLLKEAQWDDQNNDGILEKEIDGKVVDFSISYKYTDAHQIGEEIGILLKNSAKKAGIKIELIPLERNRLIEETRSRDFDLYFSRWSQRPGLDDLRTIWHTSSDTPKGYNKVGFGNARTDALIDSIMTKIVTAKTNATQTIQLALGNAQT